MGPRRSDPVVAAVAIGLALSFGGLATAQVAQPNIAGPALLGATDASADAKDKDTGQNVFSRPDRASVQRLAKARQLAEQGRYAEAVRHLGAILESSEDYFLPGNVSVRRSLRQEAQRLLGDMPRAGRELYELEYGARARQILTEAAAAGDPAGLAEVSRRFFHTRAGYEATLLLGLYHLDRASPLAGALTLQRLQDVGPAADDFEPALSLAMATCWLRAGLAEKAEQTLARLKARRPGAKVEIGGKSVPLFAEHAQALDWLAKLTGTQVAGGSEARDQWTMVGGDAARNASAVGSGPLLSLRWRVSTSDDPYVEAMIEQLAQSPRERDRLAVPTLQPLVVGNMVLMRTAKNLLGVDFRTGKQTWEVPVDDPFESLRSPSPDMPFIQPVPLDNALKFRIWGDSTYGTLSSDGQRVFAVEDLALDTGVSTGRQFFNFPMPGTPRTPQPHNRLAAYNVHTGKLEWHLGGSPEEFGLPQAGTFFMGPPLALMGRLYVIGETKGEIRLLALDSKGALLWTQQLAVADRELLNDPVRRLAGVSPSYADGILVCPTANNSIVALELSTRSLLWGYTYADKSDQARAQMMFPGFRPTLELDPMARWPVANVLLGEGHVLATPADSDRVHCLSLVDGKFLWTQPREEDIYLACVCRGKAILVGQRRVRALELASGKPAWDRVVDLPSGSSPSGIGFLIGDLYYVPLTSAEVIAVDLKQGRIVQVSRSRQGTAPGNLVCCGGMVLSQRPNGLEVFSQKEALVKRVAQRLAANPQDAEALMLRGEALWDEGKLAEAIADFRQSLQSASDPKARSLLRDALFEGLRTDFAGHRKSIEEIQRLIDEPHERATFLWLMAMGCENAGEFRNAFGYYLKLVDLDHGDRDMEAVDKLLTVRRSRWVQVRLGALRETAPPEVRAEIDQETERRLKAAADQKTTESLARFLDCFGALPAADPARGQWIAHLRRSGRFLHAELLLAAQQRSKDPQRAGAALATLAAMLADAERFQDAAACYRRLETEFADVVCLERKTGRQLVEALPAAGPVRRLLNPQSPWPAGEVLVERVKAKKMPPETYTRNTLDYAGSPGPFFADVTLELQQSPQQLVARDGYGNRRWQLSMAEMTRHGQFPFNRGTVRVSVFGHLMMIATGQSMMVVDTLGSSATSAPRILWNQNLDDAGNDRAGRPQVRVQVANLAGGARRLQFGMIGRPYGPAPASGLPGVVNDQLICFLRFRNCVAVHPLTGETLWLRQDIRPDSAIFGDDQYVFIVPPESGASPSLTPAAPGFPVPVGAVPTGAGTAMVLQATDGKLLGQRQVPANRIAVLGRHLLVWRDSDREAILELIDPWDGHKPWGSRTFAARSRVSVVDNDLVGVFEPGGRFVLLEMASGRVRIDAKLRPERALAEIHVLPSPDGHVLVTNSAQREEPPLRRTYAVHGMAGAQIARGHAYAFDRQGKPLWPSPVRIEDQFLLLAQPARLPVVTFACMAQLQKADGSSQHSTSILCIDRHSGRTLCREEFAGTTNTFQLSGDPERKTVQLQLQRETITLTFTGKPLTAKSPPEGTVDDKTAETPKKPTKPRGILEAMQRAARGAVEKTFGVPLPREKQEQKQEEHEEKQ